jgi:hypothetical protein
VNNGHRWTEGEIKELKSAWYDSELNKSDFSKAYSKIIGIGFDAIRMKLTQLGLNRNAGVDTDPGPGEESTTYKESEDFINVVCASRRMMTKDDVINECNIDMTRWMVDSFEIHTSEGYRKDRKVSWHVEDGRVTSGDVEDSGEMLVVPMYHIRVRFKRKTDEIRIRLAIQDIIDDAKAAAPRYPKLKFKQYPDGLLYEVAMPDLHYGRQTWAEETGENYDLKIAREMAMQVITELLSYSQIFKINKILLPFGNDFYNANNKEGTTSHGTRQQEDTRWQKTYRAGRMLATDIIDACASIAPVDVLIIPGNHDEERIFYLGDGLELYYHNNDRVHIDNRAVKRKYYAYGKCLIGFSHGKDEKRGFLQSLMPVEVPDLWAASKFREFHTGHVHHKEESQRKLTDEHMGVLVRELRSLVPIDAWTFDGGYVGALQAAEGFMWHSEYGLKSQFTAIPKR